MNKQTVKKKKKTDSLIEELIYLIDQAFDKRAWHGTNLKGSIRGLKPKQALWRPDSARHSILEIVLHAAYWKYIVWRKITRQSHTSFGLKGSNWFNLYAIQDESQWKEAVALLVKYHSLLRQSIIDLPASVLSQKADKSKWRYLEFIVGIASHDLYHAGQIQLLKRLQQK